MSKKTSILALLLLFQILTYAQEGWDDDKNNKRAQHGMIFYLSTTYDFPLADMADRFGNSYTLGGGIMYKSESNFFVQAFSEFIIGRNVKQDTIFKNLAYNNYLLYDFNGSLRNVELTELGLNIGIGVGKTFLLNQSKSLDNGINLMTSLSLLQHRINHNDPEGVLVQAIGSYAKGYDYLSNGLCINQLVDYFYMSKKGFANFAAGVNFRFGFTKNRRSFNYDIGGVDDRSRNDFMVGLHFKWMIPFFKRVDTDIYF